MGEVTNENLESRNRELVQLVQQSAEELQLANRELDFLVYADRPGYCASLKIC